VLSGMEFSSAYAIAVKGTSLTKTATYSGHVLPRRQDVLEECGQLRPADPSSPKRCCPNRSTLAWTGHR